MGLSLEAEFDTAVWGGGIVGVCAAVSAAERGEKTVLITCDTFLGDELTASLRPWVLDIGRSSLGSALVDVFLRDGFVAETEGVGREYWYRNGDIKRKLLDLLDRKGVTVLFMSRVSGVLAGNGEIHGLLLSNMFGIQLLGCRRVIDTSFRGDLMRMVGEMPLSQVCGQDIAKTVMVFLDAQDCVLPHVVVRTTPWDSRSYFEFDIPADSDLYQTMYDIKTAEPFRNKVLIQVSHRAYPLAESCLEMSKKYINLAWAGAGMPAQISFEQLSEWERLGVEVAKALPLRKGTDMTGSSIISGATRVSLENCTLSPFDDAKLGCNLIRVQMDAQRYVQREYICQVAVAGGGTAGVAAAQAAAVQGADVILAEQLPTVGGTQTLGLVGGYYQGYVNGFAGLDTANMDREAARLNGPGMKASMGRLLWYERQLHANGVQVLRDTTICGVMKQGACVTGLIGADCNGLYRIQSRVTVDSSGDSIVAAFAGARYSLGAERDGVLQDCSQWVVLGVGTDLDVVDPTRYSEVLRGIRLAHTQTAVADFCPILTQRESRRIDGEYLITMRDVLSGSWYEDSICVGQTDCDPHGPMSSLFGYMGLTPYHDQTIQALVPYRACIPRGIDGLLIASKGISAEQDAAAYLRMAADVQNRGYAIGTAAAIAAAEGVDVRNIEMKKLQNIMEHMQILPSNWRNPSRLAEATGEEAVERLSNGDEKALKAVLCLEESQALPLLQRAYAEKASDDVALALGWFGDSIGLGQLRNALKELNTQERNGKGAAYCDEHPRESGNHRGGIMQEREPYWKTNQILTVMGILADSSCLPEAVETASQAVPGGSAERHENAYVMSRVDLYKIPWYDRIRCICFCAERIPDKRWISPLESLLDKPDMGGFAEQQLTTGIYFQRAYLELILARTLAQCGSEKGIKILKQFAVCDNSVLAEHACRELEKQHRC